MKIEIIIHNPHDAQKLTQLTSGYCQTLDNAMIDMIYFYVRYYRIIKIEVHGGLKNPLH
jgi:hypothetical protein